MVSFFGRKKSNDTLHEPKYTPIKFFGVSLEKVSKAYDQKKQQPAFEEWVRKFPKFVLHSHVQGMIHPVQVLKLAKEADVYYNEECLKLALKDPNKNINSSQTGNGLFFSGPGEGRKSLEELGELSPLLLDKMQISVTDLKGVNEDSLKFFQTFPFLSMLELVPQKKVLAACWKHYGELKEFNQGVTYSELMYEPVQITVPGTFKKKYLADRKSYYEFIKTEFAPKYVKEVQKILDETEDYFKQIFPGFAGGMTNPSNKLIGSLILEISRTEKEPYIFFAKLVCMICLWQAEQKREEGARVVGITPVGPQGGDQGDKDRLAVQVAIIQELQGYIGKEQWPNFSMHAGELHVNRVASDDFPRYEREAVLKLLEFKTGRIGHGVAFLAGNQCENTVNKIKSLKIVVEGCFGTNRVNLGIEPCNHRVLEFAKANGIACSFAPDDEAVINHNLIDQLAHLAKNADLTYAQFQKLQVDGVRAIFMPGDNLFDHEEWISKLTTLTFASWGKQLKQTELFKKSPKAQVQFKFLEQLYHVQADMAGVKVRKAS